MQEHEPLYIPPFSREALHVFGHLKRRGGSMRIGPLTRRAGLPDDALVAAINELQGRCWVRINWRKNRTPPPGSEFGPLRDVDRITTTSFGRWRYPMTWSTR